MYRIKQHLTDANGLTRTALLAKRYQTLNSAERFAKRLNWQARGRSSRAETVRIGVII